MSEELTHKLIVIGNNNHPSIYERGIKLEVINTNCCRRLENEYYRVFRRS